jgi:hypothetical protein
MSDHNMQDPPVDGPQQKGAGIGLSSGYSAIVSP